MFPAHFSPSVKAALGYKHSGINNVPQLAPASNNPGTGGGPGVESRFAPRTGTYELFIAAPSSGLVVPHASCGAPHLCGANRHSGECVGKS